MSQPGSQPSRGGRRARWGGAAVYAAAVLLLLVEPAAAGRCSCTFEGGVLDCSTNYVAGCEMYIEGLGVETLPAGLLDGMELGSL